MKTLFLFNPENDMALASGSPYYMAPASAKKMASDLAALPAWYAEAGGDVWLADGRQAEWMMKECRIPLSVGWALKLGTEYEKIMAWGWSPALLRRLREGGVASGAPFLHMDSIRALSSRKTAVGLLPQLQMEGTLGESFWLTSVADVCDWASRYDKVLLKAPWSGSGKGIQPLAGCPDDNLKGWMRRIIASQGGVVVEPYYNKVEDFAMEFQMSADGVSFAGYSLFEADVRGIYKENWLASDEAIERRLSGYVPCEVLREIRGRFLDELPRLVGDAYQGYLGVDMMVCRDAGEYLVHPCVEVNLRMNMGVVSRIFFDRNVCPDACGRYVIEYYPRRGDAMSFHEKMKARHPLCFREGRIAEGYLSLTPVFEDTAYQIYVVVD